MSFFNRLHSKSSPSRPAQARSQPQSRSTREPQRDRPLRPAAIEPLEDRQLFSAAANTTALVPQGFSPAQIRQAYGFNNILYTDFQGKQIKGNGAGQTIAVVSAFLDPTVAKDLRAFDKQFGIPNAAARGGFALTVATPQGRPVVDADWAQETALDVEWAHAMAPAARILLVETKTDSPANLFAGVDFARKHRGVTVVSMSWGWDTAPAGIDYQSILTTPAKHVGGLGKGDGVTFVEAGSDDGVPTAFPDASVPVISVGGTTLTLDGAGNYVGETPLAASNASATIAYDADPNTGFAVFDSTNDRGVQGWQVAGGTSAGAPQWAAVFAIADQLRAVQGKHSLDGPTAALPALQSLPATDFHAIPGGSVNMGRGSPIVSRLAIDLIGV
jgi:subtilase family serine protease